jgi:hypothetical protein
MSQVTIIESFSAVDCKGHPIDLKLIQKYLGFTGGVFVEAGANNGVAQSNTCQASWALA